MAESQDRVTVINHKIDPDQLEPGDHIYIHETGGLTNKHGMVIWKDNKEIYVVAYYDKALVLCPLDEFTKGDYTRLVVYGVSTTRKRLSRRGSTSTQTCLPPDEVVENIIYYCIHPHTIPLKICKNESEAFARACTSRTELMADNPVYPTTDDSIDRVQPLNHSIQQGDLKPGDHIYAYRKLMLYSHHGIYVGENKSGVHLVIHFTGDPGTKKAKETAKVRKTSMDDFLDEAKLKLVSYEDITLFQRPGTSQTIECRAAAEVVQTAEHYAAHPEEWDDYNFATNNCENFCIFCKTGKKREEYNVGEIRDQASIFYTVVDAYTNLVTGH